MSKDKESNLGNTEMVEKLNWTSRLLGEVDEKVLKEHHYSVPILVDICPDLVGCVDLCSGQLEVMW